MNHTNPTESAENEPGTTELGVLAKYWQPGAVKTRLAATVGDDRAAAMYHGFLTTTLARLGHLADRSVIVFTPAERRKEFTQLAAVRWSTRLQIGGDLGERMCAYFEQSLSDGASRIVLIGSDSPTLPVEFVERAFRLLTQEQVVLGPTTDGGYYLVGIRAQIPPIFDKIPWSTPDVWQETVARLAQHAIGFAELPAWYDIDNEADLERLQE